MPLRKGKSKDVLTYNISEMMHSPTFAAGKSKKKKQSMAVAASYAQARKSGAKFLRGKKNPKKKKLFPSIESAIQAKRKHKKQLEEALEY